MMHEKSEKYPELQSLSFSIAGVHDIEAGPVTGLVCRPRQPQPLRERPLH